MVEFHRCAATVYPEPNLISLRATEKMKKYTKVILLSVAILLLGFGFWKLKLKDQRTTIQNEKVVQQISASLKISTGTDIKFFNISSFVGKTALEATEANAKVVANGTGTNAFVTSIDGRAVDAKKHEFWELDANGNETQVGAGSYTVQNHDQIEWKISTY